MRPPFDRNQPMRKDADKPRPPTFYQYAPKMSPATKAMQKTEVETLSCMKFAQQRPANAMSLPLRDINMRTSVIATSVQLMSISKQIVSPQQPIANWSQRPNPPQPTSDNCA